MYVYIYIYRERERDYIYYVLHIHMHMYMHICIYPLVLPWSELALGEDLPALSDAMVPELARRPSRKIFGVAAGFSPRILPLF